MNNIYPSIKAAVTKHQSFDDWWNENEETIPPNQKRRIQLAYEEQEDAHAEQEKQQAKENKQCVVLDSAGWPKKGQTLTLHASKESAAKEGQRDFGKRLYMIVPFQVYKNSNQAKHLAKIAMLQERAKRFKPSPRPKTATSKQMPSPPSELTWKCPLCTTINPKTKSKCKKCHK